MMILPENGSVVVIDDDPNQAWPIIDALAKRGIATTYFKGTSEREIPGEPLKNVRLAILDLQLNSMDNDGHTIATRLVNVLNKVISENNGPFMVLIWSLKNDLFGEEFRNEVMKQTNSRVPVCIATLEKSKCLNREVTKKAEELAESVYQDLKSSIEEGDLDAIKRSIINHHHEDEQYVATPDAVKIIEESLKSTLKKAGVFHLFVIWENLIRKAGYQMVNAVSSTIEYTELWENNMRDVLKRLAKAKSGKNTLSNDLLLKNALSTFTGSFSEELENEIRKYSIPDYIKPESTFCIAGKLKDDTYEVVLYENDKKELKVKLLKNSGVYQNKDNIGYAKIYSLSNGLASPEKEFIDGMLSRYHDIPFLINTRLHIELKPSAGHMPGNVYKIDVPVERKKEILRTYISKIPNDVSDYHFVELEVSPICDYAQKKWKKSRLLSGLVYPASEKIIKSGSFYENAPTIVIDDNKYSMVFCYLLFKSLDIKEVEDRGNPWFRIKRELLQDIISNLSSHVNRPGITTVN